MADATTTSPTTSPTTSSATSPDNGCGCCRPDPKSPQDVVRELEARRDDLERRLARLEPVGATR